MSAKIDPHSRQFWVGYVMTIQHNAGVCLGKRINQYIFEERILNDSISDQYRPQHLSYFSNKYFQAAFQIVQSMGCFVHTSKVLKVVKELDNEGQPFFVRGEETLKRIEAQTKLKQDLAELVKQQFEVDKLNGGKGVDYCLAVLMALTGICLFAIGKLTRISRISAIGQEALTCSVLAAAISFARHSGDEKKIRKAYEAIVGDKDIRGLADTVLLQLDSFDQEMKYLSRPSPACSYQPLWYDRPAYRGGLLWELVHTASDRQSAFSPAQFDE